MIFNVDDQRPYQLFVVNTKIIIQNGHSKAVSFPFDIEKLPKIHLLTILFPIAARSVLSPSSIFLQLFYTGPNKVHEQPLLINPKNSRTIE